MTAATKFRASRPFPVMRAAWPGLARLSALLPGLGGALQGRRDSTTLCSSLCVCSGSGDSRAGLPAHAPAALAVRHSQRSKHRVVAAQRRGMERDLSRRFSGSGLLRKRQLARLRGRWLAQALLFARSPLQRSKARWQTLSEPGPGSPIIATTGPHSCQRGHWHVIRTVCPVLLSTTPPIQTP
jgi:hypothetical protein